jgi:hypothetical protein
MTWFDRGWDGMLALLSLRGIPDSIQTLYPGGVPETNQFVPPV